MKRGTRALALVFVVPATFYFVFWVSSLVSAPGTVPWVSLIAATLCALLVAWYVWQRAKSSKPSVVSSALLGAILIGTIGFLAGFIGPMLSSSGAQGPMLGIFVTGPAGIIVGAVLGAFFGLKRRREALSGTRDANAA